MTLSPAYEKFPQHRIEIDEKRVPLRVSVNGEVLAETRGGVNLREGKYPAVVYVPRDDVSMDRLQPSALSTHCPFKGDANYFACRSTRDGTPTSEVAWSYETPFDQMRAIRGHIAFYEDRVQVERIDD
jgi:uncharacterized protein (DUF427 family)